MKKATTLLALLITVMSLAQSPCDSIHPISYSVGCNTFCVIGTSNPNQPLCGWQRITAQYCDTSSCIFYVNGGPPTQTPSIIFTPGAPGITNFTLTGWTIVGNKTCPQSISWSFTTVACSVTTGIPELTQDHDLPRYFDLQGNPIPKRFNTLIIEQVGLYRKKIIIFE